MMMIVSSLSGCCVRTHVARFFSIWSPAWADDCPEGQSPSNPAKDSSGLSNFLVASCVVTRYHGVPGDVDFMIFKAVYSRWRVCSGTYHDAVNDLRGQDVARMKCSAANLVVLSR